MSKLYTEIHSNPSTLRFAEHFKTKSSVKNLLQGFKHAKPMSVVIENEKFCDAAFNYSDVAKNMDSFLAETIRLYTAQVEEWVAAGETRSLPKRVLLFMDLVDVVTNKQSDLVSEIVSALGDFAKTKEGKEIEKYLHDTIKDITDEKLSELLMESMLMMVIRTSMSIACDKDVVFDDPDVVVTNASRSTSYQKDSSEKKSSVKPDVVDEEGNSLVEIEKKSWIPKDLKTLLDTIDVDWKPDQIDRVIDIILNCYPDLGDKFKEMLKSLSDERVAIDANFTGPAQKMFNHIMTSVPNNYESTIGGVNIDDLTKMISMATTSIGVDYENIKDLADHLLFTCIDWLHNPTDNTIHGLGKDLIKLALLAEDRELSKVVVTEEFASLRYRVNKFLTKPEKREHYSGATITRHSHTPSQKKELSPEERIGKAFSGLAKGLAAASRQATGVDKKKENDPLFGIFEASSKLIKNRIPV